ncbi:hypothetical protein BLD44_013900 [Mastigocladus laminosus UU774]|nr:hypothetical protein BLD44_013900 [Mastigocladus laminosus UU774]
MGHWALGMGHWALGIGHWALGIGHWALGIIPDPRSPIPYRSLQYNKNSMVVVSRMRRIKDVD